MSRDHALSSLPNSTVGYAVERSSGGFRSVKVWIHRLFTTLNHLERQENRENGSDFRFGSSLNLLISRYLFNPCAGVNSLSTNPETPRSVDQPRCRIAEFSR